jgi:hypothetical protein
VQAVRPSFCILHAIRREARHRRLSGGGFPHDEVTLRTDDDPSTYTFSIRNLWGLDQDPFVLQPPIAVSPSRARRKGSVLEVSGEHTFKSLAMPLRKGVQHLLDISHYSGSHFTDGRLVTSIAVLRAPMIAVPEDGAEGLEAVPWVRVHRYEPVANGPWWRTHELTAFDAVHEDFLADYLDVLMSYADRVATNMIDNQRPLLEGRGFAAELGHGARPLIVEPVSADVRAMSRRLGAESLWAHLRGSVAPFGSYIREPLRRQRRR